MPTEAAPSKVFCHCGDESRACGRHAVPASGPLLPGEPLARVLSEALDQALFGKGAERHGSGEPFLEQPIMSIQRLLGDESFALGQAVKKLLESKRLPGEAGDREILGAVVYAAAAVLRRRERRERRAEESR